MFAGSWKLRAPNKCKPSMHPSQVFARCQLEMQCRAFEPKHLSRTALLARNISGPRRFHLPHYTCPQMKQAVARLCSRQ